MTGGAAERVVDAIVAGLALAPDDTVLYLGAGDDRISRELAARCAKLRALPGLDPAGLGVAGAQRFNKVVLYDTFDKLSPYGLQVLLGRLLPLTTPDSRLFLGSIPHRGQRAAGVSAARRLFGMLGRSRGPAVSDRVWSGPEVCRVLGNVGLYCSFVEDSDSATGRDFVDVIATRDGAPLHRGKRTLQPARAGGGAQSDGGGGV